MKKILLIATLIFALLGCKDVNSKIDTKPNYNYISKDKGVLYFKLTKDSIEKKYHIYTWILDDNSLVPDADRGSIAKTIILQDTGYVAPPESECLTKNVYHTFSCDFTDSAGFWVPELKGYELRYFLTRSVDSHGLRDETCIHIGSDGSKIEALILCNTPWLHQKKLKRGISYHRTVESAMINVGPSSANDIFIRLREEIPRLIKNMKYIQEEHL